MTMKDVANAANVSSATVSRVLNNPESVSEKKRNHILSVIKKLGYIPNSAARALVMRRTRTIGIIVNNLHDPFFHDLIKGFETGALQTNYNVIFCSVMNGDYTVKEKYLKYLNNGVVDAVIIYGSYMSDKMLTQYMHNDKPIKYLTIENDIPNLNCNKLLIDNFSGAKIATNYLIDNNHTHIAHICGNPNKKVSIDRFNGFIDSMHKSGLEVREGYIQYASADYKSGYDCMMRLLENEIRPTAVCCSDDSIAVYAIRAAIDSGLRVPQDISIMGFDNQSILPDKYNGPDITSIEQPLFKIGSDSINVLVNQLENDNVEDVTKTYGTKLVLKDSVRKLD